MLEALRIILRDDLEASYDMGKIEDIISLMETLPCNLDRATELLKVPAEKQDRIRAKVQAALAQRTQQDQTAG